MKPNLECKFLLKTNTYLPEVPNYWLDSTSFPIFDEHTHQVKTQKVNAHDEVIDSTEISKGPFISACYSEDGEILAVSNLEGIYILGSYTRTCFAFIPFTLIKKKLGIEESISLICIEIYIFEKNCLLGALFDDFLVFWDISSKKFINYECYLPKFIGTISVKDLFLHIDENKQQYIYLPAQYFNIKDPNELEKNKFVSIKGIKTLKSDNQVEAIQNIVTIEFVLELNNLLPLLVQLKTNYNIKENKSINEFSNESIISQELTINFVSSIFPNNILNNISTKYIESGINNKLVSFAVLDKGDHRIYSSFIIIGETNILLIFDESKTIHSFKIIPSYGKRHYKYLYSCNIQFNMNGDIIVIQYSDRFTVYSLKQVEYNKENSSCENDSDNDNDNDFESDQEYLTELGINLEKYVPKLEIKLLYSYSQVIQKEWITCISIYSEKIYDSNLAYNKKLYGPTSQLYPCGILAVSTISSNGQSFYYLMKICSNSDKRSFIPNSLNTKCNHFCSDNTGSNMIVWKMDLSKLNGVRKLVWQPGDSICLAIQFTEKLKNTKLKYDDYYEMNSTNLCLSQIDKNNIFGKIFFINSRCTNDDMLLWSRLMIDFTAIHRNKEYIEKEDEFDYKDEEESHSKFGEFKKTYLDEYYNAVSKSNIRNLSTYNLQLEKVSEELNEFNKNLDKNVYWFEKKYTNLKQ